MSNSSKGNDWSWYREQEAKREQLEKRWGWSYIYDKPEKKLLFRCGLILRGNKWEVGTPAVKVDQGELY